jgi:hypothetical protein
LRLPVAIAADLDSVSNTEDTRLRRGQMGFTDKKMADQGLQVPVAQETPRHEVRLERRGMHL